MEVGHNLLMETKVIAKFAAAENTEIHVAQITNGYSVVVFDIDAQEFYPMGKIFKTEAQAMAYATAGN